MNKKIEYMTNDLISRQAAIDIALNYRCNHDITIVPNTDYSRGFYAGYKAKEEDVSQGLLELEDVAPSEIIRCKDCWYYELDEDYIPGEKVWVCYYWGEMTEKDDFCSFGKRSEE